MSLEKELIRHSRAVDRINTISRESNIQGSAEHIEAIEKECGLHLLKLRLEAAQSRAMSKDPNALLPSITLTKGRGLLIIGPAGSGKSVHARTLAGELGKSFVAVPYEQFARDRCQSCLASEPDVLVIDDAPITGSFLSIAKVILHSELLIVNEKMRQPKKVRAPHLIVTSNSEYWPTANLEDLERHFEILHFPLSFNREA